MDKIIKSLVIILCMLTLDSFKLNEVNSRPTDRFTERSVWSNIDKVQSKQWDCSALKNRGAFRARKLYSKEYIEFCKNVWDSKSERRELHDYNTNNQFVDLSNKELHRRDNHLPQPSNATKYLNTAPDLPLFTKQQILTQDQSSEDARLISLSLSEKTPVKDVILEIARLTDLNVFIDPKIDESVLLQVKDRPLHEVMQMISDIADLRYAVKNDIMSVTQDVPTSKHYIVDFLNIVRSSEGSFDISTKVLSSSSDGINSGSQSSISAEYKGDLWDSLEHNLKLILDNSESNTEGKYYAINKEAGIITVRGRDSLHKCVQDYLDKVKIISSAQVLIEAKIVEVFLSNEFKAGVNWSHKSSDSSDSSKSSGSTSTPQVGKFSISSNPKYQSQNTIPNFQLKLEPVITGGTLQVGLDLLSEFGEVRTISSPRLHAINNQQSVLTFAKNYVYFELDITEDDTTSTTSGATTKKEIKVNSKANTVPIGTILMIQPSINLETQEITMSVRPTLSRIADYVRDPAVDYINSTNSDAKIVSIFPIVEVRELDSMLKIRSGDVMLIGGLIEQRKERYRSGVPVLKDFPLFGAFFRSRQIINRAVETVILLKATIIPSSGNRVESYNDYKLL